MIEITVKLENAIGSKYEVINISKEELLEFACNKAKDMYFKGTWDKIFPVDDEIIVKASVV